MSEIDIQNPQGITLDEDQIRQAILVVLARHPQAQTASVTVVIADDEVVQTLNRQHRGVDTPTDVLSFPADPLPPELAELEGLYLGDLVIAYPYASAQAKRLHHSLNDTLALLVVHGTLHLLGYDHDTRSNRAQMWAEQSHALEALNIDTAIVPALEDADHA
ncbi:MAG: rRNA maturation RNase YbeY [Anaerolineae bacterium]